MKARVDVWLVWILAGLAILLAGGCATPAMKATPFYQGRSSAAPGVADENRLNLWPLAFWQAPTLSVCWPVYEHSDTHLAVRPFYSRYRTHGPKTAYDEFNWLYPLSHFASQGRLNWIFPMAWADGYSGIWPFFHAKDDFLAFFPFYWQSVGRPHETLSSVMPFYYYHSTDDGRQVTAWVAAGLAGYRAEGGEVSSEWLLPLYFHGRGLDLRLAVYGETPSSDWLLPFWYRDDERLWTIPWFRRNNAATGETTRGTLLGLAGWTEREGSYRKSWFYPFYHHESGRLLWTPLYADSRSMRGGRELHRRWWAFMLAGCERGWRESAWLFPFYSSASRGDFASVAMLMDGERLADGVETGTVSRSPKAVGAGEEPLSGSETTSYLFLFDRNRFARVWRPSRTRRTNDLFCITRHDKIGNVLLANYSCVRTARFDLDTRLKTSDSEETDFSLLGFLFDHCRRRELVSGRDYQRDRLLWRFWHYERLGEDRTLDFFPGFSWDSREDGSCRASFLWRFFRYERKAGRKADLDLLYIPIFRGGGKSRERELGETGSLEAAP